MQLLWKNRAHSATMGTLLKGVSGVLSSANITGHKVAHEAPPKAPTSHWDQGLPKIKTKIDPSSELYILSPLSFKQGDASNPGTRLSSQTAVFVAGLCMFKGH